jgi:hypothetical protein
MNEPKPWTDQEVIELHRHIEDEYEECSTEIVRT